MGPLIPLFWTSGDVSSGSQMAIYLCFMFTIFLHYLFSKMTNHQTEILHSLIFVGCSSLEVRAVNDQMLQVERAFINPEGLPNQPYKRSVTTTSNASLSTCRKNVHF